MKYLFPHKLIPHLVWIGTDGVVKAITSAKELTDININKILQKEILSVHTKKDVDINMPLYLSKDFINMDSLMGYSILYKGSDPATGQANIERQVGQSVTGRLITNYTLLDIYKIIALPIFSAIGENISDKKVIVSVPDEALKKLKSPYCFDMLVPLHQLDSLYPFALKELNRMSGFNGSVCKHKIHCLVLKKIKDTSLLNSTSTTLKSHLWFDGSNETYMQGAALSLLVNRLNELSEIILPVADGTGYTGKAGISLSGSNDLSVIRKDLQKYGLDLVEEEKEINVLMITKPEQAMTKK